MAQAWRWRHGRTKRKPSYMHGKWITALYGPDQHERWWILLDTISPPGGAARRYHRNPPSFQGRWENLQIAFIRWQSINIWSFETIPVVAVWYSDEKIGRDWRNHYPIFLLETFFWATTGFNRHVRIRCFLDARNRIHAFASTQRWE